MDLAEMRDPLFSYREVLMSKKIFRLALEFRVHPAFLKNHTYVPDPVDIIMTGKNPSKFMMLKIFGGSGLKMWLHNGPYTFTRKKANLLIKKGYAKLYVPPPSTR